MVFIENERRFSMVISLFFCYSQIKTHSFTLTATCGALLGSNDALPDVCPRLLRTLKQGDT